MKIIGLKASNIKRLHTVEIHPDAGVVSVGGRNGHGKTSLLDAITMALSGAGAIPSEPVRKGAISGEVVLDLGEIVVSRTFDAKGGTKLEVRNAAGGKLASPQGILDALVGKLACDPVQFMRLDRHKQLESLKRLVGLDFTDLDTKRAAVEEDRKIVGRDGAALKAKREAMPHHPGVPSEEVSAVALLAEIEAARAHNASLMLLESQRQTAIRQADKLQDDANRLIKRENITPEIQAAAAKEATAKNARDMVAHLVSETEANIARLQASLLEYRAKHQALSVDYVEALTACDNVRHETATAFQAEASKIRAAYQATPIDSPAPIAVEPLTAKLATIEDTNRKIRDNLAQRKAAADIDAARARWDELTAVLGAIDEEKRKQLAAVEFPVAGLSFDSSQVLFQGVPFSQASGAEQLRISMAMAIKMNPKLRVVLIRDASILDEDSMAMVAKMAADHDVQIWVEIVTKDPSECAVYIEDGEVRHAG